MYAYIHSSVYIHIFTCTNIHIYMYVYVYTYVRVCILLETLSARNVTGLPNTGSIQGCIQKSGLKIPFIAWIHWVK